MNSKSTVNVQCHCGEIQLALLTDNSVDELPVRRCLCGFCTSHGSVYTSDSDAKLEIRLRDPDGVSRYRNPHSISEQTMFFLVRRTCGVAPAAISEIDGREYAVVNVTAVCAPPLLMENSVDMDFDEETLEGRLARRKKTWI
ncbi:MAG: hypothetical protein ACI8TQ_003081 [Planctomycetota bacterium]|jgi:hypothetical protein